MYFQYVRSLRFEDKPDYAFLRRMFRDLFAKEGECQALLGRRLPLQGGIACRLPALSWDRLLGSDEDALHLCNCSHDAECQQEMQRCTC